MTRPATQAVMGWPVYVARFEAVRPATAEPVSDAASRGKTVAENLGWMDPILELTGDNIAVQLSLHAPSAEAALAHVRGSLRSALQGAGVPGVGRWPLVSLSVVPAGEPETAGAP